MTNVLDAAFQVALAIGSAGGLTALFRYSTDRRKAKNAAAQHEIDATKVITATAVGLLKPLQDQITAMSDELTRSRAEAVALRDDVRGLHEWIQQLIDVIEGAGLPVPPRLIPPQPSPPPARRRTRRDRHEPEDR